MRKGIPCICLYFPLIIYVTFKLVHIYRTVHLMHLMSLRQIRKEPSTQLWTELNFYIMLKDKVLKSRKHPGETKNVKKHE